MINKIKDLEQKLLDQIRINSQLKNSYELDTNSLIEKNNDIIQNFQNKFVIIEKTVTNLKSELNSANDEIDKSNVIIKHLQLTNQLIAEQKDKALATVDNKIEVLDFQKKSNIVMKNLLDKTIESNDKYQETIKEIRAIVLGGKKKIIDLLNLKHDDLDTIKLNLDFLIKKNDVEY